MATARTITSSWADPVALAKAGEGRSGLAFLSAIVDGTLPQGPLFDVLGIHFTEVAPGRAVFECEVGEPHYNLIGSVHGGFAATLIDSATGCAVYSTLEPGDTWTTLNLRVDYIRPLRVGSGVVRCIGTVARVGGRIGLADGELRDADDKLIARGQATCMIFRAR